MRLEPFGTLRMRYSRGSFHRPYGGDSTRGAEGIGFGTGDGQFTGALEGAVVWSNYPRRREDGVWTPNLRGCITTSNGDEILISIHGQSVEEAGPGSRRAILARIELTTEVERFKWLNTSFLVGEGEIDGEREEWWLTTYVCVNEEAVSPPAIGAEPPEHFRQRGRRA